MFLDVPVHFNFVLLGGVGYDFKDGYFLYRFVSLPKKAKKLALPFLKPPNDARDSLTSPRKTGRRSYGATDFPRSTVIKPSKSLTDVTSDEESKGDTIPAKEIPPLPVKDIEAELPNTISPPTSPRMPFSPRSVLEIVGILPSKLNAKKAPISAAKASLSTSEDDTSGSGPPKPQPTSKVKLLGRRTTETKPPKLDFSDSEASVPQAGSEEESLEKKEQVKPFTVPKTSIDGDSLSILKSIEAGKLKSARKIRTQPETQEEVEKLISPRVPGLDLKKLDMTALPPKNPHRTQVFHEDFETQLDKIVKGGSDAPIHGTELRFHKQKTPSELVLKLRSTKKVNRRSHSQNQSEDEGTQTNEPIRSKKPSLDAKSNPALKFMTDTQVVSDLTDFKSNDLDPTTSSPETIVKSEESTMTKYGSLKKNPPPKSRKIPFSSLRKGKKPRDPESDGSPNIRTQPDLPFFEKPLQLDLAKSIYRHFRSFYKTIIEMVSHYDGPLFFASNSIGDNNFKQELKLDVVIEKLFKLMHKIFDLIPESFWKDSELGQAIYTKMTMMEQSKIEKSPINENLINTEQTLLLAKKNILDDLIFNSHTFLQYGIVLSSTVPNSNFQNSSAYFDLISLLQTVQELMKSILSDVETFFFLQLHPIPSTEPKELDHPSSINQIVLNENSTDLFAHGTIDGLIFRLVVSDSLEYQNVFLTSYSHFIDPCQLWEKFSSLYDQINFLRKAGFQITKQPLLSIILRWLRQDCHLFDLNLINSIYKFLEKLEKEGNNVALQMRSAVDKRMEKFCLAPYQKECPLFDLIDISPLRLLLLDSGKSKEIAEQLTLIDIEMFQKIDEREFLNQWNHENTKVFSRKINNLIKRANQVSGWVCSVLVIQEHLPHRVALLKDIILIANWLFQLGNFNSLMGILLAFENPAICKLKQTWLGLSKKYTDMLQNLAKIKDPTTQWKNLREALKSSKTIPIPYLAPFLQNFASIDENSNTNIEEHNHINIYKFKSLFDCISPILQSSQHDYPDLYYSEQIYIPLCALPVLSSDEIYALSALREPKK
eukprot:TRINITY_DN3653_c0_g1_i2.p1 TRINITY_DN3653_c0_g1~~TRINITY_DN3653_c0_g1_i2.p1  ORF type:complete len:1050 (+),score=231.10 TRINITY_DN3653_c0_g1_i2:336-3485(+)